MLTVSITYSSGYSKVIRAYDVNVGPYTASWSSPLAEAVTDVATRASITNDELETVLFDGPITSVKTNYTTGEQHWAAEVVTDQDETFPPSNCVISVETLGTNSYNLDDQNAGLSYPVVFGRPGIPGTRFRNPGATTPSLEKSDVYIGSPALALWCSDYPTDPTYTENARLFLSYGHIEADSVTIYHKESGNTETMTIERTSDLNGNRISLAKPNDVSDSVLITPGNEYWASWVNLNDGGGLENKLGDIFLSMCRNSKYADLDGILRNQILNNQAPTLDFFLNDPVDPKTFIESEIGNILPVYIGFENNNGYNPIYMDYLSKSANLAINGVKSDSSINYKAVPRSISMDYCPNPEYFKERLILDASNNSTLARINGYPDSYGSNLVISTRLISKASAAERIADIVISKGTCESQSWVTRYGWSRSRNITVGSKVMVGEDVGIVTKLEISGDGPDVIIVDVFDQI